MPIAMCEEASPVLWRDHRRHARQVGDILVPTAFGHNDDESSLCSACRVRLVGGVFALGMGSAGWT